MIFNLQAFGDWLHRHQAGILRLQWGMACLYAVLLLGPFLTWGGAALLTRWAEVVFWGVWWPGVILSVMLVGQFWCGLLCPDGALTEWSSRYGRGLKPAAWMRHGWLPVVLFSVLSVVTDASRAHDSPMGVLLTVGGASLAALVTGLIYGRGKRIWCRYLCPMAGLFSLLGRCSPLYFHVDRVRWDAAAKPLPKPVECPLLLDVRRLVGTEKCNMCARCSGHRDAVRLAWRMPGAEIAGLPSAGVRQWEALAICFVLIGLAHGGAVASGEITAILILALGAGTCSTALLLLAAGNRPGAALLSYALLPLGGAGLFLAALSHAAGILSGLGVSLPLDMVRLGVLTVAALWSAWLAWVLSDRMAPWRGRSVMSVLIAGLACTFALAPHLI